MSIMRELSYTAQVFLKNMGFILKFLMDFMFLVIIWRKHKINCYDISADVGTYFIEVLNYFSHL